MTARRQPAVAETSGSATAPPFVLRAFERHVVRLGVAAHAEMRTGPLADDLFGAAWGVPGDVPRDLALRIRGLADLVGLLAGLDASIAADEGDDGTFEVEPAMLPVLDDVARRMAAAGFGPELDRVWADLAVSIHRLTLDQPAAATSSVADDAPGSTVFLDDSPGPPKRRRNVVAPSSRRSPTDA